MRRVLLFAVLLVGCTPPAVELEQATYAAALGVDLASSTKVSGMYLRDITVGTGTTATTGQRVTMRYTGWLSDGTQFDSDQGAGFSFRPGAGDVIQGWELGVPGMNVGGTRQLIIPPSLGYGEAGRGPIPGNAILVFNVTLVNSP